VNLSEFDSSHILSISPPDGEFVAMNYRVSGDLNVPFRIFPFVEDISDYKLELIIKVRATFPGTSHGVNVNVMFKVPRNTT
jgi:hypothetical protein